MKLFRRNVKVNENFGKRILITNSKINRRYSPEWQKQGNQSYQEAVELLSGLLAQRRVMLDYIEELHNYIDNLLEK